MFMNIYGEFSYKKIHMCAYKYYLVMYLKSWILLVTNIHINETGESVQYVLLKTENL